MSFTDPSAKWPGSTVATTDIGLFSNRESNTLASAITASSTSIVLSNSIAGLPSTGVITIGDERILYTSKDNGTKTLTVPASPDGRGWDGSTAAAHSAGDIVKMNMTAHPFNQLLKEVVAIETYLAAGGAGLNAADNETISGDWTFSGTTTFTGSVSGLTVDHGTLTGLGDDDHTQYHTDARALTWLGTRSTTDLSEGTNLYYTQARFDSAFGAKSTTDLNEGSNLYFTDERSQDAIGSILTDTSTIDATYDDATPQITFDVLPGGVDHDALLNFVADEHIAHSGVDLTAGAGLTGGGTIASSRTFNIGAGTGITVNADDVEIDQSFSPTWTGTHDFTGGGITVPTPGSGTSAANKDYVDGVAQGLDWKDSVRVASTTAGTLATDFENGDTLDGVVLSTGDRILLKDQADASENGIRVVQASGTPTRAVDADEDSEVTTGLAVWVSEGTTNGDTLWVLTTNDPIVVDTTSLSFTQVGAGTGAPTSAEYLTLALNGTLTGERVFNPDGTLSVTDNGANGNYDIGVNEGNTFTWTASHDFSGGGFIAPIATVPAQTVEGEVVWDSDDDLLTVGDGVSRKTMVDTDSTQTVTGKSVDLTDNTLTGTLAEFNTALSDGDFASLAGSEALTNKTIDGDLNTLSNLAHGAEVDNPSSGVHGVTGSVVGTTDTQTLTNKTLGSGSAIDLGSDAEGDLYYRNAAGDLVRLGIGTAGQVLTESGGVPSWADAAGGGSSEWFLTPGSAILPDTDFPALTKEDGTNIVNYYLGYDDSTKETAWWNFHALTAGNVTVTIYWRAAATTGDVVWRILRRSVGDGDTWDSAPTTNVVPPATTKGTANQVNETTQNLTAPFTAGDWVQFAIARGANEAGDTMTGDALLLGVKLEFA